MHLFEILTKKIENKLQELIKIAPTPIFRRGWRFLYNSKKTIDSNNGICLLALNPGGKEENQDHGKESCENGSAILTERWKNYDAGMSLLQIQYKQLFMEIAANIGEQDYKIVLEKSLIGFFIPFRSPNFEEINLYEKDLLNFGKVLWSEIFSKCTPKVIVCIDQKTYKSIHELLVVNLQFKPIENKIFKSGWGNVTVNLAHFHKENKKISILRLPHLSTYKLFSNDSSKDKIKEIIKELMQGF